MDSAAETLLKWYDEVKRDLPWRKTSDPYRIWLSEIMLQQTRVEAVKGYYARFLEAFPTVEALAQAPLEEVLKKWEGLGYYSRARNLHRAAGEVCSRFGGHFPQKYEELLSLPGIGHYTAGAVASIAFSAKTPAIDGNVNRVITRLFCIFEDIASPAAKKTIAHEVESLLPGERPGDFNQALMELGATLCSPTSPGCGECPLSSICRAYAEGAAEILPVHQKKKPQKTERTIVCLVTWKGRILVQRRNQKLLGGMYVFYLPEEAQDVSECVKSLENEGIYAKFVKTMGEGRHVFTHRIWEMEYLHFTLTCEPDLAKSKETLFFADLEKLDTLPMPSAMNKARQIARKLLK